MEEEKLHRLTDLMSGFQTAMMTTIDADNHLRSRPMQIAKVEVKRQMEFIIKGMERGC